MCFLSFQANLILVPFPAHRQQVPSMFRTIIFSAELKQEPSINLSRTCHSLKDS